MDDEDRGGRLMSEKKQIVMPLWDVETDSEIIPITESRAVRTMGGMTLDESLKEIEDFMVELNDRLNEINRLIGDLRFIGCLDRSNKLNVANLLDHLFDRVAALEGKEGKPLVDSPASTHDYLFVKPIVEDDLLTDEGFEVY